MYIIILHTTLLVSNTKLSESLSNLLQTIEEYEIRWPSRLTFNNGRIYDLNRPEMDGIRAISHCLNKEKELFFIQQRDDLAWLMEKKQEISSYNESFGNELWVNFFFSEKTKKVLGPRKQKIPTLTDAGDRISLDNDNRIRSRDDCLLLEQKIGRNYILKKENCSISHQVICTKKLNVWLTKDYETQVEEAKALAIFQIEQFQTKINKTYYKIGNLWSKTQDILKLKLLKTANNSGSLPTPNGEETSKEKILSDKIKSTIDILISELNSNMIHHLFLARIAVVNQLVSQFVDYIENMIENLETFQPSHKNYKFLEIAKNFTETEEMSFYLIFHNFTSPLTEKQFWWRHLISNSEHDKISLPDLIIMSLLSPIIFLTLIIALGAYCYKTSQKCTTATVRRITTTSHNRDCSPNKLIVM